jgi:hypothetical protein
MFNLLYAIAFGLFGMLSMLISPLFLIPTIICAFVLGYSVYDDERFDPSPKVNDDKGYD